MSNDPLRLGCPCCAGTGQVSYLRGGAWLNQRCPGKNGPVDDDGSPLTHELDNYFGKRKARIEYKRPNESVRDGQEYHFRAELESTAPPWETLLVLILDEGQGDDTEPVRFQWRSSSRARLTWDDALSHTDTIGSLGDRISAWLWPQTQPAQQEVAA